MLSAMNECNPNQGQKNTTTGLCECEKGWKFADCSEKVTDLSECKNSDCNLTESGPAWFSLAYYGDYTVDTSVTVTSNAPTDIFVSKGSESDPNNFFYDYAFINVTDAITLNATALGFDDGGGYAISLRVNAGNET